MNGGGEGMRTTRGVQGTEESSLKGLTERVLLEGVWIYSLPNHNLPLCPIIRTPQSPRDKRLLKYFSEVSRVGRGGMAGGGRLVGRLVYCPTVY